jgi:hypothetical protein
MMIGLVEVKAPTRRSKKMRSMAISRLFAISAVLLSGTPAFAAPEVHHNTGAICRKQTAEFCRRSRFNVEIPGTINDGQAKANAASKTWPGNLILG